MKSIFHIRKKSALDRALLIRWYNLRENGHEAYLGWLHGIHIPTLLKRPGVLWAAHYVTERMPAPPRIRYTQDSAVPTGTDYILMLGAESSHAFSRDANTYVDPDKFKPDADLTADDRKMLALRMGERVNLMTEEARVDGPEIKRRRAGTAPAPCIQLGSFNGGSPADEDELLAWYARWRMPALQKLPGCVALRKMVSVSGWAKHGVLYEFASLKARNENVPRLAGLYPEMEAWTNRFIPKLTHAPGSPHVACRTWPPVKD
jgi:hypothetical protein